MDQGTVVVKGFIILACSQFTLEFCFGGHSMIDMTGVFKVVPRVGPPGVFFR